LQSLVIGLQCNLLRAAASTSESRKEKINRYEMRASDFPKPLRTFYCGGGARAFNRFTSGNAAINEIERQCGEKSDFCHRSPLCLQEQPNGHGSRI
jgi:hypothetical protein